MKKGVAATRRKTPIKLPRPTVILPWYEQPCLRYLRPGTTRKIVDALGAPKKKAGIISAKDALTVRAMKKTNTTSGLVHVKGGIDI